MANMLTKGSQGVEVEQLQQLLNQRGYPVKVDGIFDNETYKSVRAFQSQNLDQHGQPLKIDGKVGPLTWWSLTHPKPIIVSPVAIDFTQMPPEEMGGSNSGRAALEQAIKELNAGAGEVGGDNSGPWVRTILALADAPEGSNWCASFVSWCFYKACGENKSAMPFRYTAGARDILAQLQQKKMAYKPDTGYLPLPGDIVVWWRVSANGWQGHVGLVHQYRDGWLYTIEGNKSPMVQGFSYVLSQMEKLLGFGHIIDNA